MKLEKITPWATQILAIYGLVSLLAAPGWWIYEQLSMDNVAAIVSPICERDVFLPADSKDFKYLGVNILALNTVHNARVRFSDVFGVAEWGMYSDGLSDTEMQDFLRELPTGVLPDRFLTSSLPDLPTETSTTLMMRGLLRPGKHCRESFADVTAASGDVYHIDPSFTYVRDFPRVHFSWIELILATYLLPLAIFSLVLLVRRIWPVKH